MLAATRSNLRDRFGDFVVTTDTRATLISLASARAPVRSLRELLARRDLRVAVVRGFDYGEAYRASVAELAAQGRLVLESSPANVARVIDRGVADATIMLPLVLAGAILEDGRVAGMLDKLRIEPLKELSWAEAGTYVSRQALAPADRAALKQILATIARSKQLWDGYRRHYPQRILEASIRLH